MRLYMLVACECAVGQAEVFKNEDERLWWVAYIVAGFDLFRSGGHAQESTDKIQTRDQGPMNFSRDFPVIYKKRKTRVLKNGVSLEIGWHVGRGCLYAEVYYTTGKYNTGNVHHTVFHETTSKMLLAKVRLTLSRGPENIGWEKPMMHRLVGKTDRLEDIHRGQRFKRLIKV